MNQALIDHARLAGQRMHRANLRAGASLQGICMAAGATLLRVVAEYAEVSGPIPAVDLLAMHEAFCDAAGIRLEADDMGCPIYAFK